MGIEVQGVEKLLILLKQGGEKAVRGASKQMEREADDIRDLARQMAPIDEGDLENAIVVTDAGGGRDEYTGRFVRKHFSIGIDENATATDRNGNTVTVASYAYLMHEYLAPYGSVYQLGSKSRAKQAGSSVIVGGKYLERAAARIEKGLINRIVERVDAELDNLD